jgi:hypothetical protein
MISYIIFGSILSYLDWVPSFLILFGTLFVRSHQIVLSNLGIWFELLLGLAVLSVIASRHNRVMGFLKKWLVMPLCRVALVASLLVSHSAAVLVNVWIVRAVFVCWLLCYLAIRSGTLFKKRITIVSIASFNYLFAVLGIILFLTSMFGVRYLPSDVDTPEIVFSPRHSPNFSRIYDLIEGPAGNILFNDRNTANYGKYSPESNTFEFKEGNYCCPERFAYSKQDRLFMTMKRHGHGDEGIFEVGENFEMKSLFPFHAIDIDIYQKQDTLISISEGGGEIVLYDIINKKLNKVYLKAWNNSASYSLIIDQKSGKFIMSMWFAGCYLVSADITEKSQLENVQYKAVGFFSLGMALDEDRDLLYVARPFIKTVDVFRTSDMKRIMRIKAPMYSRTIALARDGALLIATNYFSGDLAVIRTDNQERCASYKIGPKSRSVIYSKQQETIYVSSKSHIYKIPINTLPEACF